jgi:uncharacterized LabA/DUF88 family protein
MEEERIGLFLDFENLAIGAREQMGGTFDFKPIADALAERGRVVVRRAYADWSMFDDARRELTRHHIELIEIPQRMGAVRKNAADIKLAVDAIELSLERPYVTTFVIGTGDSDFTPLVHKLRELNKRVIGIGIEASTSNMLPPACDEFLFYERLPGVDTSSPRATSSRRGGGSRRRPAAAEPSEGNGRVARDTDIDALGVLVTQTLSGLKRRGDVAVLGSSLKRTLLRKDPTFDESVYGFRGLGEMLRALAERNIIQLSPGSSPGDPAVDFPQGAVAGNDEAFQLLRDVVADLGEPHLPGLKNQVRKRQRNFTEKKYGYGGFLQFAKAAEAAGYVQMEWNDETGDYVLRAGEAKPAEEIEVIGSEPAPESTPEVPVEATEPEAEAPKPRTRRKRAPARPKAKAEAEAEAPALELVAEPAAEPEPVAEKPKRAPRKRAPAKRAPRKPKA